MKNKIVYNACFGGFCLSNKAIQMYAELKGIKLYAGGVFCCHQEWYTDPELNEYYCPDYERHDKDLVKVVEVLGEEADGYCAKLRIYETDSDQYIIGEYNGCEFVIVDFENRWVVIK